MDIGSMPRVGICGDDSSALDIYSAFQESDWAVCKIKISLIVVSI